MTYAKYRVPEMIKKFSFRSLWHRKPRTRLTVAQQSAHEGLIFTPSHDEGFVQREDEDQRVKAQLPNPR